jgi:hypothetical protein
MLDTAIAYTPDLDVEAAARDLASQIEQGGLDGIDALILFASPQYDQPALLRAVVDRCKPKILVGASSAGEFTSQGRGTGLACALALRSDEILFASAVGQEVGADRARAASSIARSFRGSSVATHPHRAALVMTDALAGYADDLVDQLTLATSGQYQFFGGGAGDDAQFRHTRVFHGTEAMSDAAVALEILSRKPLGIGVGHGWLPASPAMRVTEVRGATLVSLDGEPAADAFAAHAERTGQTLDRSAPISFFLHNILGIDTGSGHRLRVPLSIGADGSVLCASELPLHAKVHIMKTDAASAIDAAKRATQSAVSALQGAKPKTALFFDCVATRLRIGEAFGLELDALSRELGPTASYLGCNTHGQIARAPGQFNGFHNCTAVVCVLPE